MTTAGERDDPPVTATVDDPVAVEERHVSRPYLLNVETGERTRMAEGLVSPTADAFVPSPDGTRLAFATCKNTPCSSRRDELTVANIDGTDVRSLVSLGSADATYKVETPNVSVARWSPDGSKLLYQEEPSVGIPPVVGNLFVLDLASGRRTQVTNLKLKANWYLLWAQFSPDGRNVIFQLPRDSWSVTKFDVWSVPVSGGKRTLLLRDASFAVPFPDGEKIAFVPDASDFSGRSIAIADSHGHRRTLVEAKEAIWAPAISPDGTRIAYVDGFSAWLIPNSLYVVEVSTGEATSVAEAHAAVWLDNDTLIVTPPRTR